MLKNIDRSTSYIRESYGTTNSNVWFHDYDFDQEAGYPSDSAAANLSKMTTKREIIEIEGKEKDEFKRHNIDTLFGPINSIGYCEYMLDAPSLDEVLDDVMLHLN